MIELAFILLATTQTTSDKMPVVVPSETTELAIEYPYVIEPYLEEYQDCIRSGAYIIGDGRNFEEQYREDIPRCAATAKKELAEAQARLEKSKAKGRFYNYDVAAIFEKAREIHIWRGRNLDRAIHTQVTTSQPKQELGLVSAACVAELKSLREERQKFAETEGAKIEAVYAKNSYTREDQIALFTYQRQLAQYSNRISYEMSRCPAEARTQRISSTNASN